MWWGFYLQSVHLVTDNQITTVRVTFGVDNFHLGGWIRIVVLQLGPILSQGPFTCGT